MGKLLLLHILRILVLVLLKVSEITTLLSKLLLLLKPVSGHLLRDFLRDLLRDLLRMELLLWLLRMMRLMSLTRICS
jgi:hypothetical protein